ncbi:hypothetical protein HNP84_000035 [Thermocatellispora tengchongensis]|uniref:Uncharacterized protein n=1 Tax=Thermocatellispora tengchongensis TaxID=1073253 RepID=A0A840NZB4_9ACTN|nr:hypothetical protein [Thermocatellispora tengchongensis]MBB5130347.1 hypothetical protein [Thermocatellispora tengchongensis]
MPPVIEDPVLDWGLRPRRHILRWALLALAGAVVVAGAIWLVVRLAAGTSDPAPSEPAPTATALTLARPSAYHGPAGYPIGFPRTELGAASAAAAALEAAWTLDGTEAEQAAILYAPPEQHQAARDGARAAARDWRQTLGLPTDGDLPEGAAMRTTTIGVQWRKRADDLVLVSVLVQVNATKGVEDTGATYSSPYALNLLMAWRDDLRGEGRGDWVNVPDTQATVVPKVALPGTDEFRSAGWYPIAGPAQ